MEKRKLNRRDFLRLSAAAAAGAVVAACAPAAPQIVEVEKEVPIEREVVKTVEVERIVRETVVVEKVVPAAEEVRLEFWTMNYGVIEEWVELFRGFADQFKEETGITVDIEIINWAQARDTYLLVSSGGVHPDAADMFWLYTHVQLGKYEYGPMPITEYKDLFWPDLEERFYGGALKDVFWQGEFYGIPWRGDIRPMLYRTDFLEEAGFTDPPATWDDLVEYGKALTKRDADGNVTCWGIDFAISASQPAQGLLPLVWQAGGEFMTPDGMTATIDTPEVREALQFVYDCMWTHEIAPLNGMDPSWVSDDEFMASRVAIRTMVPDEVGRQLEKLAPELNGKWAGALPPKNKRISSYSGAGYWGVLQGTEHPRETCQWIQFLSRDENMLKISRYLIRVTGNKKVMQDPFWQETPWNRICVECLKYAHTSQHPTPAWAVLMLGHPGAVLYDMMEEAWIRKLPIPEVTARMQKRMQEEMDAAMG